MAEPIRLPYRWKYLAELPAFRSWFAYGENPNGSHVDINDGYQDVLVGLPREAAEKIIRAREWYLDAVCGVNTELGGHG